MSKAITFAAYGAPEVLRPSEVTPPEPAPGQARIRVRAASVHPLDLKIRPCRGGRRLAGHGRARPRPVAGPQGPATGEVGHGWFCRFRGRG